MLIRIFKRKPMDRTHNILILRSKEYCSALTIAGFAVSVEGEAERTGALRGPLPVLTAVGAAEASLTLVHVCRGSVRSQVSRVTGQLLVTVW